MNKRLLLLVVTHGVLAAGAFAWGWRVASGHRDAAAGAKPSDEVGPAKPGKPRSSAQGRLTAGTEPLPQIGPEEPAAFVAWAKALEEESGNPFGNNPAHDQLRVLFHRDRERALRIAMLARQQNCESLFAAFAAEWAKTDFRGALEWAKRLTPEAREAAFTALVGGITAENASEVIESFLPDLPRGYPRDRTLRVILAQWSSNDPEGCFAWVQSLPAPEIGSTRFRPMPGGPQRPRRCAG